MYNIATNLILFWFLIFSFQLNTVLSINPLKTLLNYNYQTKSRVIPIMLSKSEHFFLPPSVPLPNNVVENEIKSATKTGKLVETLQRIQDENDLQEKIRHDDVENHNLNLGNPINHLSNRHKDFEFLSQVEKEAKELDQNDEKDDNIEKAQEQIISHATTEAARLGKSGEIRSFLKAKLKEVQNNL